MVIIFQIQSYQEDYNLKGSFYKSEENGPKNEMRGVFIFIIMQLCYNKNDYTLRILENACEDVF